MKQEQNNLLADKGKTFRRISDGFIMGRGICLGINPLTNEQDTAENYEEIDDIEIQKEESSSI